MIRKGLIAAAWMLTAPALYFFENNTGTRIVLFISSVVCFLLFRNRKKQSGEQESETIQPHIAEAESGDTEPGDVRDYVPGDPVARIHWKLSAKTDRLLIRQDAAITENALTEEAIAVQGGKEQKGKQARKRVCLLFMAAAVLSVLLLFLLPEARRGAEALCNRLFDWSERLNPYIYERFHVPEGQSVALAIVLLSMILLAWGALLASGKNRLLPLLTAVLLAGFQVYFGVSLSAWANALLFALLGFLLLRHLSAKTILYYALAVCLIAALVVLFWPGVDAATEAASERVRDALSQMTGQTGGSAEEAPADGLETRRVNSRSLLTGGGEAQTDRHYRLVTVEEQQISMPHWVDVLKIALLLLASVALVVLPFVPFVLLNARKKKAREARAVFDSENVNEAVSAMFRHVIAWLDATGHSAGNLLFRDWTDVLNNQISPDYAERYALCAALFEEAEYSSHPMTETQRVQMRSFLDETERGLYSGADWKQRLRINYGKCLRA